MESFLTTSRRVRRAYRVIGDGEKLRDEADED
jgi:hypothetical protein